MEAGKRNITDIFNRARSLEIPFFQRAYVWEDENWQRFLNDMLVIARQGVPYFLGSVILKQRGTLSSDVIGDVRVVVDGQQRLTTTVLFFKALYEVREGTGFRETFFNLANEICLKHNHNDFEIFEAIVAGGVTQDLRTKYAGNRVLGAYDFFLGNAALLLSINPIALLSRVYFVGIDLSAEEDEQQIFDTINSLGVSLTTAELLKNELFRRSDLPLYDTTWKATFECDEDAREYWERAVTAGRIQRENVDLLLQSFLTIRRSASDAHGRSVGLFRSYQAYLKEEKEKIDKVEFVHALQRAANTYRRHIRPERLDEDIGADDAVARLNVIVFGLNTTTVIPYLLFLLESAADKTEVLRMLRLVEAFLIRRLICRRTTKNYNNFFSSLVRNGISSYQALRARFAEQEEGNALTPNDEELATGFAQSTLTNQQARVVLYLLEKSSRDQRRHSTAPLGMNHYSLEHVMPKKWRNHWAGDPTGQAAEQRDKQVLKLGNLTLITGALNSTIRDADWATKKNGNGAWYGLARYAAGLEIFDADLKRERWDEQSIHERTQRLTGQAKAAWPLAISG